MSMIVPDRERGAALLAVLLLVAVMGAISAAALEKLRLSTAAAANGLEMDQARAFATGVESLLLLTLDDIKAQSPDRTTLAGGWNGAARQYPVPGGGIATATLRDGGNCFNVNSLVQAHGPAAFASRPTGIAQFVALMRFLEVPEGTARRIAEAAADWADSDGEPNRDGGEDSQFLEAETPHRTGNTLFAEVSELRALAAMDGETYDRVRPWLCALPVTDLSPINVNTIGPDQAPLVAMLAADQLSVEAARRVIAERPAAGWDNLVDFWDAPAFRQALLPAEVQSQPQIRTGWFSLDLHVELERAELVETALVDAREGPARIVARRWGADE